MGAAEHRRDLQEEEFSWLNTRPERLADVEKDMHFLEMVRAARSPPAATLGHYSSSLSCCFAHECLMCSRSRTLPGGGTCSAVAQSWGEQRGLTDGLQAFYGDLVEGLGYVQNLFHRETQHILELAHREVEVLFILYVLAVPPSLWNARNALSGWTLLALRRHALMLIEGCEGMA